MSRSLNDVVRPAYATVRAVILGISTLAVVGVLFSVYQYSTGVGPATATAPPTTPVAPETPPPEDPPERGIALREAQVGHGERISIALYGPHSDRARAELTVRDYQPSPQVNNEFHLDDPEIRLRATSGQEIRVTATEGWVQFLRGDNRTPEVKSGRLVGNVAVDMDRLSEKQRAALPPEERDRPDEERLIHLEFEEVFFDLEQSSLDSPGAFTLEMAEAELKGAGLRVRYNDVDSRVELFQINRLDSLVMYAGRELFDLSMPGTVQPVDAQPVEIQPAEEQRLAEHPSSAADQTSDQPSVIDSTTTLADADRDDIPVFVPDQEDKPREWPAQTYRLDIEQDVVVRQMDGQQVAWSLDADKLELLFDFGAQQREAARRGEFKEPGAGAANAEVGADVQAVPPADKKVILTCSGPFTLRPVYDEEVDSSAKVGRRLRFTASGDEVKIGDGRTSAVCSALHYEQDSGTVRLTGRSDKPVVLESAQRARLVAADVLIDRRRQVAVVTGPARLAGFRDESQSKETGAGDDRGGALAELDVRFDEPAELILATHTFDRVNPITHETETVQSEYISGATFSGNASMKRGDDLIAADSIVMAFDPPETSGNFAQNLQDLQAHGNVAMHRGPDRVTCDDLSVLFGKDPAGATVPRLAEAKGDVVMTQAARTIQAAEQVTIHLTPMAKEKAPFDPARARVEAVAKGLDPAQIDWDAVRQKYESNVEYTVGLKSLSARKDVTVTDPSQGIEVAADELACEFSEGQELRSARLTATEGERATVRLANFSVEARSMDVDMPEQRVDVPGAGELSFLTTRGLDGSRSANPQQVTVTWDHEMVFRGAQNTARFRGHVSATTKRRIDPHPTWMDRLTLANTSLTRETSAFACDELVIDFAEVDPQTETQTDPNDSWWILAPAAEAWRGTDSKPSTRFNREPVYLVASRDVVSEFTNSDLATGRVKSRARIESAKLAVDLRSELLTVPCPGNILIEDYQWRPRRPGSEQSVASPFAGAQSGLPSQSYIAWGESMSYHYGLNRADFRSDVVVDHRTGGKMAYASQWLESDADQSGRRSRLQCQSLVAEFAERDQPANNGEGNAGQLSVRDIRQLDATGQVMLLDDDITITAHRIVRFPKSDLLRVFGLDNADAEIYGSQAGGPRFRGPEFSYNLVSGQVEAAGRHQLTFQQ